MNATITDSHLEEMMVGEIKCQALHPADTPMFSCTVEVTHRYRGECRHADKLVCSGVAARVAYGIERDAICASCKSPVANCWSVTPV